MEFIEADKARLAMSGIEIIPFSLQESYCRISWNGVPCGRKKGRAYNNQVCQRCRSRLIYRDVGYIAARYFKAEAPSRPVIDPPAPANAKTEHVGFQPASFTSEHPGVMAKKDGLFKYAKRVGHVTSKSGLKSVLADMENACADFVADIERLTARIIGIQKARGMQEDRPFEFRREIERARLCKNFSWPTAINVWLLNRVKTLEYRIKRLHVSSCESRVNQEGKGNGNHGCQAEHRVVFKS